jgi:hypothetical protein
MSKVKWAELIVGIAFVAIGIPLIETGIGILLIPAGLYLAASSIGVKPLGGSRRYRSRGCLLHPERWTVSPER